VRFSLIRLSCSVRIKGYGTYQAGAAALLPLHDKLPYLPLDLIPYNIEDLGDADKMTVLDALFRIQRRGTLVQMQLFP